MNLTELRNNVAGLRARKANLDQSINSLQKNRDTLEGRKAILQRACELARLVLQGSFEAKESIENLLTRGLTDILGSPCSFILKEVVDSNGNPKGYRPLVKEAEGDYDDPNDSFGNGGKAIMSICIKIAEILTFPGVPKLLVMDEPLAPLSVNYQERFESFMKTICNLTGIQIVQITHQPFPFGKIYRVTKDKNGISSVAVTNETPNEYE